MIRVSSNNITELQENEIFVFGSNIMGFHGKGAAKLACEKFGAKNFIGWGLQDRSYAIPTKDQYFQPYPVERIKNYVDDFINFASSLEGQQYTFLVTEIGCGLAGYHPRAIGPLFQEASTLKNVYLPKRFWSYITPEKIEDE